MSEYLPWSEGNPAICQRCGMRGALNAMVADGNVPGMRVHEKCRDDFDPWRLPARRTEDITLQYPRPDVNVTDEASAYGPSGEELAESGDPFDLESSYPLALEFGPPKETYLV